MRPTEIQVNFWLSFISVFALITVCYYFYKLRAQSQEMMKQSSELAHDCETLLMLIKRVSAIPDRPEKSDTFLRDMEKYIKKWRAVSSGRALVMSTEVEFIPSLVDEVISNLKLSDQFKNISFTSHIKNLVFARINTQEFSGSIRSLLTNSAQAILDHHTGIVQVTIEEQKEQIWISIQDNGKGIPPEVQARIFERGVTFGKIGGTGLGLSSTKARLESWGGGIELINSTPETGTLLRLTLPKAPAPSWFQGSLRVRAGKNIIHVDDDASMLPIMESKMIHFFHELDLHFFISPESCMEYLKTANSENILLLIDYYFQLSNSSHNQFKNGIELIKSLNAAGHSILLTNAWADSRIQAQAQALGVRIMPKQYLNSISFEIIEPLDPAKTVAAVLIDNHESIRMDWSEAATSKGLLIVTCSSVSEFLERYRYLPKSTPIYVDEHLDGGLTGKQESIALAEAGFQNLSLTTFDPTTKEDLHLYPHLRGTRGKNPPF